MPNHVSGLMDRIRLQCELLNVCGHSQKERVEHYEKEHQEK